MLNTTIETGPKGFPIETTERSVSLMLNLSAMAPLKLISVTSGIQKD